MRHGSASSVLSKPSCRVDSSSYLILTYLSGINRCKDSRSIQHVALMAMDAMTLSTCLSTFAKPKLTSFAVLNMVGTMAATAAHRLRPRQGWVAQFRPIIALSRIYRNWAPSELDKDSPGSLNS